MTRPRFLRLLWLIPLGLLLLPLLCWTLLLVVVPTDWARGKMIAQLSESTGRSVRLEGLQIDALGGVRLTNLEIGTPQSTDDPWLKVAEARTDLNLMQLLSGHMDPTVLKVDGLTLRVLRRKDGSLELSDLLKPETPTWTKAHSGRVTRLEPNVEVQIRNAQIVVINEPTQTKVEIMDVEGHATWNGPSTKVQQLRGALNGGPFNLTAEFDRSGPTTFEGQIRARDVALAQGMNVLSYLVPVLAGTPKSVDGKLALDVFLKGQGASAPELKQSLVGNGMVKLDPIQVDGSKLMAQLGRLVDVAGQSKVGSVKTDFEIKGGRISTNDLTLNLGKAPIVLNGWTDFDGKLDYRMKTDQLVDKLPSKAKNFLSELSIDMNEIAAIKVQGTLDTLVVTLDGVPLNSKGGGGPGQAAVPRLDDKQRLRELGNRLKDKFLR